MSKSTAGDWREVRKQAARDAILDAAWELVAEEGLAALSLRELASRAGVTTPTIYAYFGSKHDIYDAMFGQAATECLGRMAEPHVTEDPREVLREGFRRFVEFCTADVPRYQLLFQRTIPGFEPSPGSFAPAVETFALLVDHLAGVGVTDPRLVDLWTAITTGLVDQQISNDPGGDRWTRLTDDLIDMYLAHATKEER